MNGYPTRRPSRKVGYILLSTLVLVLTLASFVLESKIVFAVDDDNGVYRGFGRLERHWNNDYYWASGSTRGEYKHSDADPWVVVRVVAWQTGGHNDKVCPGSTSAWATRSGWGQSGTATTSKKSVYGCPGTGPGGKHEYRATAYHSVGNGPHKLKWYSRFQ